MHLWLSALVKRYEVLVLIDGEFWQKAPFFVLVSGKILRICLTNGSEALFGNRVDHDYDGLGSFSFRFSSHKQSFFTMFAQLPTGFACLGHRPAAGFIRQNVY